MKIFITGILLLLLAVSAYAADFTVTLTARESALLLKVADWKNTTRQQIAREAIVERLNYEKEIRKQQVMFSNESTICTNYDCR